MRKIAINRQRKTETQKEQDEEKKNEKYLKLDVP